MDTSHPDRHPPIPGFESGLRIEDEARHTRSRRSKQQGGETDRLDVKVGSFDRLDSFTFRGHRLGLS